MQAALFAVEAELLPVLAQAGILPMLHTAGPIVQEWHVLVRRRLCRTVQLDDHSGVTVRKPVRVCCFHYNSVADCSEATTQWQLSVNTSSRGTWVCVCKTGIVPSVRLWRAALHVSILATRQL